MRSGPSLAIDAKDGSALMVIRAGLRERDLSSCPPCPRRAGLWRQLLPSELEQPHVALVGRDREEQPAAISVELWSSRLSRGVVEREHRPRFGPAGWQGIESVPTVTIDRGEEERG